MRYIDFEIKSYISQ